MPDSILALLSVAGAILLGAMSPGPSFVMIAQTAVTSSRLSALAAAAGMGVGCMIFSTIALAGLHSLLVLVPWLYAALKTAGGVYLLWLGFRMLTRSGKTDIHTAASGVMRPGNAFIKGLVIQLSNPNTAIVFGSIFAAILSKHISPYLYLLLPVMAFCIDAAWYGTVAWLLSSEKPRKAYISYRNWFDKAGGLMMSYLGIKLILR
ncbi:MULTISPECIES: LysE family translocator [Phytobacter]|uniref:Threonine transporter n=1 Tax=Phytobacter diazotrophicus TaxID=395631 RepID=A0ABM7VWZ2_9ENTR|nr:MULTISPECIES: LysE family transporter [Phytobacter]MDU4149995.1 LysE family transporter [Enterobacteriaceae bacterium]MDU7380770.1 LysE family transporter [Enterobacteriaceae bacterium]BBE78081.1 threonine transporter [Phytobacter sp. MRY16-398]BDD51456.1 threonine transporter [Phytobacter diazotrophicus]BEG82485.1 LysE family translocator [Phytobacter diazotrophicus]